MNNINTSLIFIQQRLKAPKGQLNDFGHYKYRSCEDILEAIKPILSEVNCSLILQDELMNIGERYYVKATATLSDGENAITTTAYAREEEVKKGMDGSQITGASSSYARKYALNGLFAIDDTKDSDYTNTGKEDKFIAPTAQQLEMAKTLGIDLEKTARHFNKSVDELNFDNVKWAINAKRNYEENLKKNENKG